MPEEYLQGRLECKYICDSIHAAAASCETGFSIELTNTLYSTSFELSCTTLLHQLVSQGSAFVSSLSHKLSSLISQVSQII